ncbi:MAG: Fe-S cluster assembly protein NifU [Candidatus Brocadiae bacterium]|nr:Fe-S cluster assembly protein NifU [Candidatus Brocadiia bacterium]
MWDYSEKVMEHFFNPKNMGELKDANAVGLIGSIVCGDALKLFLKVDENNRILDASFQTFGCGSAIASSSMLTEMVKGKTLDEALLITNEDIANALGGLPPEKMHCSVMGREALEAAIKKYRGEAIHDKEEDESRIICRCFGITENKIRRNVVENKLKTVQDVINYTKAGGGCSSCHTSIQDVIDDVWKKELSAKAELKPSITVIQEKPLPLNNLQKIMKIQQTIEEEIKPALMVDGGSLELIDVAGNTVKVKLHGACSSCPSSSFTIKTFVQRVLREKVEAQLDVVEVR